MSVSPKSLLLASSLAVLVAAPCFVDEHEARAQAVAAPPGALTNYPACTTKPSETDSQQAHNAYLLGKRFFEESDYTSASHNFIDAFKLDCSKPELLLNVARANELLGNRPEAIHALETYMARSTTLGPDDKASLQRRIDNLKAAAAQAVAPPPPVAVAVTPPPAATTAPPPPTPPPPPPPEERKHTAWPWVVTGVGGAAVIAGGALYLVGAGKVSDASKKCPNSVCPASDPTASADESEGNTGNTLKSAGAGVFWAGVAVAGGGLLWHFLEPTGPEKSGAPKASFTPVIAPGYGGASLAGRF
jgi:hypothetical protein